MGDKDGQPFRWTHLPRGDTLNVSKVSKKSWVSTSIGGWLVWNMNFMNFHILGISLSQLTNSDFSEGWLNHQPDIDVENPTR